MSRELQIKDTLVTQQKVIKSLLGDKAKSDKFMATALKVATDYKLAKCNVNSIVDACINVAQMGLDLSPTLSHAYLVPFKSSVQLIVSARGYVALLSRTGWKVKSYIVNEADSFVYNIDGFDENIIFTKDIDDEVEKFKYAVALAQSPDGTLYVEVMNAKQIDKHRRISQNQSGAKPTGVWADWFDEMAKKTVIKKLAKSLPIGETVANAMDGDDKVIEAEVIKAPADLNAMMAETPPHNPETGEVVEADLLEDIEVKTGRPVDPRIKNGDPLANTNADGTEIDKDGKDE